MSNEWQPIETAPRDGTAVWILIDGHPYIGYFDHNDAPWSKPKWFAKASFKRAEEYQKDVNRRDQLHDEIFGCHGVDVSPTHWQPLPEPPR